MSRALDRWLGRPLATSEEAHEHLGVATGIAMLGLDALGSASYGPEAALTLLIPLGAAGIAYLLPIVAVICVVLAIVAWSYRQTIAAYPGSGGSFIVARENLGERLGALAAAALGVDYILNVAVGISAGVGAITSAVPALQPHTLVLCLGVLAVIAFASLRGVRQSAHLFAIPTFAFVGMLGLVIAVGVVRAIASGGAPHAVAPPPHVPPAVMGASAWLAVRAFASGTTAMTGVEAVSNAVPLFRAPTVDRARKTLTAIIAILVTCLLGIAYLCRAYHIAATEPGEPGYQSVLSMLSAAVLGRGVLYDIAIASILAVLTLSANTSFAAFPRLCSQLAGDEYLPSGFAERGRRLVYTRGIVLLACLSVALLVAFGGVTDRLIPLFAIGALLAFTLSQAGMVFHWRRVGGPASRRHKLISGIGASATGITVVIVAISKFVEGAWLVVIVIPLIWFALGRVRRSYRRIERRLHVPLAVHRPDPQHPVVLVAATAWNRLTRDGIEVALALSDDVHVVEIRGEHHPARTLESVWHRLAWRHGDTHAPPPELLVLESPYREVVAPFLELVQRFERDHPGRTIAVVLPELIPRRWYQTLFYGNRGLVLELALLQQCSDRVVVIAAPTHAAELMKAGARVRRRAGTRAARRR